MDRGFENLRVWQQSRVFVNSIYDIMEEIKDYGFRDQIQRAAVSISSNIAEGAARSTDADFAHFLDFALGSAFEVETQLKISKNVGYFKNLDTDLDINFQELMNRIHSIERQLNALISSIRKG